MATQKELTDKVVALVERDVFRAEKALEQAKVRPSVPSEELAHLEELLELRKSIRGIIRKIGYIQEL